VPADTDALIAALTALRNDLQAPAAVLAPAVTETLAALAAQPGTRLARMSGSGATCFGLYDDDATAAAAAAALSAARPRWWVAATRIGTRC
jgi:4-diphosphocytidyl-2-C-methyl-D-erythritol kinase